MFVCFVLFLFYVYVHVAFVVYVHVAFVVYVCFMFCKKKLTFAILIIQFMIFVLVLNFSSFKIAEETQVETTLNLLIAIKTFFE